MLSPAAGSPQDGILTGHSPEAAVADDPRVEQMLDEVCDFGCTPEEVCRTCPELLPEVRRRLLQMRLAEAELDALFPVAEPASVLGGGSGLGVPGRAADEARDLGGMAARGVPTADTLDYLPQADPPMIGRYRIVRRLGQGGVAVKRPQPLGDDLGDEAVGVGRRGGGRREEGTNRCAFSTTAS